MSALLLEVVLARNRGGWLEELTGIHIEVPGEWYWRMVGIGVGITVLGRIIGGGRRR